MHKILISLLIEQCFGIELYWLEDTSVHIRFCNPVQASFFAGKTPSDGILKAQYFNHLSADCSKSVKTYKPNPKGTFILLLQTLL